MAEMSDVSKRTQVDPLSPQLEPTQAPHEQVVADVLVSAGSGEEMDDKVSQEIDAHNEQQLSRNNQVRPSKDDSVFHRGSSLNSAMNKGRSPSPVNFVTKCTPMARTKPDTPTLELPDRRSLRVTLSLDSAMAESMTSDVDRSAVSPAVRSLCYIPPRSADAAQSVQDSAQKATHAEIMHDPLVKQRRSAARMSAQMHHKKWGSVNTALGSGSHYSRPVEMPRNPPSVNIRPSSSTPGSASTSGTPGTNLAPKHGGDRPPQFAPVSASDSVVDREDGESRVKQTANLKGQNGADDERTMNKCVDEAVTENCRAAENVKDKDGNTFTADPLQDGSVSCQQSMPKSHASSDSISAHSENFDDTAPKTQHQQPQSGHAQPPGKLKKQITKVVQITKLNAPVRATQKRKRVKDGQVVFKGHKSWEIVLSIQFGLRYTSDLLHNSDNAEPTAADFRESLAFDFNPIDDQRSASVFDVNKYAKWVHPAPYVYRRIRAKFGVEEQGFLDATCSESRVRELPTPGKSGALFYITDDENYFMKTITHNEEKMLLSMLPSYYDHVCKNPLTFLTQYLAHFSVQTTRNRHIRMVVMASVFNDSVFIDKKYDLKGSTHKRFAKPEELHLENVTLKDQDFESPIFFNPVVVDKIHTQMAADAAYLASHHVMDYSLLLGMSAMLPEEDGFYKQTYGANEEQGPYFIGYQRNAQGDKVGYRICLGIIDFLQRFRARKKVEYGCKVLQTCSAGSASVAPPHLYRERFLSFLQTKLLPDPTITAAVPDMNHRAKNNEVVFHDSTSPSCSSETSGRHNDGADSVAK